MKGQKLNWGSEEGEFEYVSPPLICMDVYHCGNADCLLYVVQTAANLPNRYRYTSSYPTASILIAVLG